MMGADLIEEILCYLDLVSKEMVRHSWKICRNNILSFAICQVNYFDFLSIACVNQLFVMLYKC